MSCAVFDTNLLASGFVAADRPESTPGKLMQHWEAKRFELAVSDVIIVELVNTLSEPYFQRRLTPEQIRRDLLLLRTDAVQTEITVTVQGIATHPEDDLILATAASARADFLVTGDTKLQALGMYAGVRIISPRAFLDLLDAGG